jgi:hypothetical protein
MNLKHSCWVLLLATLSPAGAAVAQQAGSAPTPVELPKPQDIDPAVDTSPVTAKSAGDAPIAAPTAAGAAQGAVAKPPVARSAPATAPSTARAAAASKGPKGAAKAFDRLELDTTQITGNRELPKVLYIVPWKRSDLGDLVGRPVNSLLDEVLTPVDRDVFQRENRYYDALKPELPRGQGAAGRGTQTTAPGRDEK